MNVLLVATLAIAGIALISAIVFAITRSQRLTTAPDRTGHGYGATDSSYSSNETEPSRSWDSDSGMFADSTSFAETDQSSERHWGSGGGGGGSWHDHSDSSASSSDSSTSDSWSSSDSGGSSDSGSSSSE